MNSPIGRWSLLLVGITLGWLVEPGYAQRWRGNGHTGGQTMVMEWRCSRCNGVLGQGSVRPSVDVCHHCRAKMLGGGSSASYDANKIKNTKPSPLILGLIVLGVVCVVAKTIHSGRKAAGL